jgi:hypothetical protein
VGVAGVVGPMLPELASAQVLDRLGLVDGASPFLVAFSVDLRPLGLAALLFVVAEAFRRGAQIAAENEGLV